MSQEANPYRSPDGSLANPTQSLATVELVRRGRLIFIAIAFFVLGPNLALQVNVAREPTPWSFGLSVLLFYFAWRGHGWAIAFLGLFFGSGLLVSAIFVVPMLARGMYLVSLVLLGIAVSYGVIVLSFIYSESLNAFFKYQAARRRTDANRALAELEAGRREPASQTGDVTLTTVATFNNDAAASVCRQMLEDEGITAFVVNAQTGAVLTIPVSGVFAAKVQVAKGDADRAFELIRKSESPSRDSREGDEEDEIQFACESCGKTITFASRWRGRVQACPHCGEYVDVPE